MTNEIIIDTIVFDYLTRDQKAIPSTTYKRIQQADTVYVCVTSIWELANHVREGLIPITADFDTVYKKSIETLGLTLLDTQWAALRYLASFDYQIISKPWQRIVNGKITTGIKTGVA